jgi:hypothetical protein
MTLPSSVFIAANSVNKMALVIVRHRLSANSLERQARLGPVKRLDLALLIAAQDQGILRGIEIQPDDVLEFLGEVLVVRYLKAL